MLGNFSVNLMFVSLLDPSLVNISDYGPLDNLFDFVLLVDLDLS